MCHGITASGKACGRHTVEWCHQHIAQKPIVAEPIVAEPIVAEPIVRISYFKARRLAQEYGISTEIIMRVHNELGEVALDNFLEQLKTNGLGICYYFERIGDTEFATGCQEVATQTIGTYNVCAGHVIFATDLCAANGENIVEDNIVPESESMAPRQQPVQAAEPVDATTKPEKSTSHWSTRNDTRKMLRYGNWEASVFFNDRLLNKIEFFDAFTTKYVSSFVQDESMYDRGYNYLREITIHDCDDPNISKHNIKKQYFMYFKTDTERVQFSSDLKSTISAGSFNFAMDHKLINKRLYDLGCLIKDSWYKNTEHLWNLAGFFAKMPVGDTKEPMLTMACILNTVCGNTFDIDIAMNNFIKRMNSVYGCKFTESEFKRIAARFDLAAYSEWKAKYEPKEIKESKKSKVTSQPTASTDVEQRLGKRWVSTVSKLCTDLDKDYNLLIDGMQKEITVNGDYTMADWRDEFVKPNNRVVSTNLDLSTFMDVASNWTYGTFIEAAKLAAFFTDSCLIVLSTGHIHLRNDFIDVDITEDATTRQDKNLLTLINFRCTDDKMMNLGALIAKFVPLFHKYSNLVCKWDMPESDKKKFSFCAPYRGQMLSDDDYDEKYLDRFFSWSKEIVCDENEEKYKFLLDYYEHTIRFKNAKTGVALIMYSKDKGLGKSISISILNWVLGSWNVTTEAGTVNRTVGERNSHLIGKKVCGIEELKDSENVSQTQMEKWKDLITNDEISTTPLYSQTIRIKNYTNHIITTNNLYILYLPTATNDQDPKSIVRRFAVFNLNKKLMQNRTFYESFQDYWKTQKFADHFYTYFMKRRELASSAPLTPIISPELIKIIQAQRPPHMDFWDEIKESPTRCDYMDFRDFIPATRSGGYKISKKKAYEGYQKFCTTNGIKKVLKMKDFISKSEEMSYIGTIKHQGDRYLHLQETE